MLAPFPRTSVYPTIMPKVQKNNKKLGKVSHQMQKIIEDIQGKRSEDFKYRDFVKTDEGQRKRTNLRENEDPSNQNRRYQRRKSRRTRDYESKLRETACQTTLLEDSHAFRLTDRELPRQMNKKLHSLEMTCERQAKKLNLANSESGSHGESQRIDNKYLKAEVGMSGCAVAPWMRPLPPVPEPVFQQSKSQAHVYQRVFETLTARMKAEMNEDNSNTGFHEHSWTSLAFSPSKSLSNQIEDGESPQQFSRYVDIDVISEKKRKPQAILLDGDQISSESDRRLADYGDDDEDHIYESIDENSDCEDDKKLSNCRELFPNENTPASVHRLPNLLSPTLATPFRLRRIFPHEDTYLEPVCPQELAECKSTVSGNVENISQGQSSHLYTSKKPDFHHNASSPEVSPTTIYTCHKMTTDYPDICCSKEYPSVQCSFHITDFQYSRDFAASPTWPSSPQQKTLSVKATYV